MVFKEPLGSIFAKKHSELRGFDAYVYEAVFDAMGKEGTGLVSARDIKTKLVKYSIDGTTEADIDRTMAGLCGRVGYNGKPYLRLSSLSGAVGRNLYALGETSPSFAELQ